MISSKDALWIAVGIIALFIVMGRILRNPMSFFGVLLRNLVFGVMGLAVIDYLGKGIGLHVPFNLQTAGVASLLGLPGVAALAVVQHFIL
ncbi:MAG: pro-sigmaK processing inhibitor BofA family protein [Acidibacillus sp.]|uniref:Pro-sigmaK processing inhibitor BofA n=1 Tax=Sulfoacidibacillus ferrooxidans TaxID=2005001 RepID=A0A9X1V7Y4_9BACL|nr:pro-sigmaK processing inhibitor BofA family protein [Sulfoacidibacillus ferrooxidans]MCI0182644.1 hypothetical protein [Sulfoacidibacillus ferrooxidans]MCY0894084.1 pro-sigmaK processing inhibitor BofA family protein [Acidibacillus sp.]